MVINGNKWLRWMMSTAVSSVVSVYYCAAAVIKHSFAQLDVSKSHPMTSACGRFQESE
jgi:hypothetical protein